MKLKHSQKHTASTLHFLCIVKIEWMVSFMKFPVNENDQINLN
jgi:hypothetical protein